MCVFYVFVFADFLPTVCLQDVLCMWVLWASQLSYSCVVWPLCLIIYSLRCHTAGWLCSLQLVFHFSSHLARLNKTVSILKALSFNHAVARHKVMAAAGRCNQSLNKTPPKSQHQNLCKVAVMWNLLAIHSQTEWAHYLLRRNLMILNLYDKSKTHWEKVGCYPALPTVH